MAEIRDTGKILSFGTPQRKDTNRFVSLELPADTIVHLLDNKTLDRICSGISDSAGTCLLEGVPYKGDERIMAMLIDGSTGAGTKYHPDVKDRITAVNKQGLLALGLTGSVGFVGGYVSSSQTLYKSSYEANSTQTDLVKLGDNTGSSVLRFSASVWYDNKLWLIGGFDGSASSNQVLSTTDGLNFTVEATLPEAVNSAVAVVYDNKIVVLGGFQSQNSSHTNKVFTYDGSTWTTQTADWGARSGFGVAVHDNKIWLLGGWNGSNALSDLWYWNGSAWIEQVTTTNIGAVQGHALASLNGDLFLVGGSHGGGYSNSVYKLNQSLNGFTSVVEQSGLTSYATQAVTFGSKIIIYNGRSVGTHTGDKLLVSSDGENWLIYTDVTGISGGLTSNQLSLVDF